MEPTAEPTMEPTSNMTTTRMTTVDPLQTTMYTTQDDNVRRRRLLQVDMESLDPNCDNTGVESQYFPPYPCADDVGTFSCWKAARKTSFLNFTEGTMYDVYV